MRVYANSDAESEQWTCTISEYYILHSNTVL